jgi:hypothetical protein
MGTTYRCKIYSRCENCKTLHGNHHAYSMRFCSVCYYWPYYMLDEE